MSMTTHADPAPHLATLALRAALSCPGSAIIALTCVKPGVHQKPCDNASPAR